MEFNVIPEFTCDSCSDQGGFEICDPSTDALIGWHPCEACKKIPPLWRLQVKHYAGIVTVRDDRGEVEIYHVGVFPAEDLQNATLEVIIAFEEAFPDTAMDGISVVEEDPEK